MKEVLKAIQYKNLDEAQRILAESMDGTTQIFDDAGTEPQGLLSIIPQDRLPESEFYRLLDTKKGILVEVEKNFLFRLWTTRRRARLYGIRERECGLRFARVPLAR